MTLLLVVACAHAADGVTVRTVQHAGASYQVVEVDLRRARVDLYGQGAGSPQTLDAVAAKVAGEGRQLAAAMNAGMYDPRFYPVGLYVERGEQRHGLVIGGDGNFGLLPNGVFAVIDGRASVVDSVAWAPHGDVWLATQSGPMLVIHGALHPKFTADSPSLNVRNGVGVRPDGTVVLVKSVEPVRFWDLATLFRDDLGCPDALYLDGAVSSLWTAPAAQDPAGFGRFSGILAVTVPRP